MKKLLVVAVALAGALFAAAPVTVTVAKGPIPAKCLFFPGLQADCRAAIRAAAKESPLYEGMTRFPSPWYFIRCEPNPPGAGTLLSCE